MAGETSQRRTAIGTEQQRVAQGTSANLRHQAGDQCRVTASAEHTAQPQTSTALDSHRHSDTRALRLHPNLISLHLSQVSRPFN
jgi:hypothetical protein